MGVKMHMNSSGRKHCKKAKKKQRSFPKKGGIKKAIHLSERRQVFLVTGNQKKFERPFGLAEKGAKRRSGRHQKWELGEDRRKGSGKIETRKLSNKKEA